MPLQVGARLGAYEVLALIGAGGMGEVYRARDTRLKREVALKVLPDAFSQEPDRLARFQREAELLATLNHPNIAAVYGLEQADGVTAIVLELVEGETLADQIARGPIAVSDALPIARQIADALEAAHEKSVIHRDLKPANIKVTPEGKVKVLDFGLAKMVEHERAASSLTMSPTLSVHATYAGVILGTAAYMSPEQARGKPVDRRADIWAFGCVCFEMLAGQQAFEPGETVSDAIVAILSREPDWNALPVEMPAPIRTLLRRCLQKDPQKRLPHIGIARIEIDDGGTAPALGSSAVSVQPQVAGWRRGLPWAVAGALVAGLATVLVSWVPWRTAPVPPSTRLEVGLGADASLVTTLGAAAILSPDGRVLAFTAQKSGGEPSQLYLRRLEQLQATPLSGTDDANSPFFSPDGQWIGFFAGGKLKKISVTGGAAVTLCDAPSGRGGSWTDDGSIVFLPLSTGRINLLRVSSAGGKPEPLTTVGENELTQRWPQVLPGGKAVLYTVTNIPAGYENANLVVQPLPTGARKVVVRGGYYARYLPSGHLVYIHDGTLFAAPFDLDRLELTGQAVPALEGVASSGTNGSGQFAVSGTGTLVYLPGTNASGQTPISWLDPAGTATPLRAAPSVWSDPHFSPDGSRLAMTIGGGDDISVWIYEWERDRLTRLTLDPGANFRPVWTADSRRIVFASARAGDKTPNLYWQRADGTGDAQRLTESKNPQFPASWHPSGKFLAFQEFNPQTRGDLLILPMEGDETAGWKPGKPTVFLDTPANEQEPNFSPDGHWLAYYSNESGRNEVWVRPFPGPGGKWLVSSGGGQYPTWSRTRRELFYQGSDQHIMVASYSVEGNAFRADKPRLWSDARYLTRPTFRSFDLHPDGDRVALATRAEEQPQPKQDKVVFIFNFFDELRRIAPVAKR